MPAFLQLRLMDGKGGDFMAQFAAVVCGSRDHRRMNKINTVVFDVGWVLVHLDFKPLLSYLHPEGGNPYTMKEVVAAIDLEAHERGELPSTGLIDNLMRLKPGLDRGELKRRWLDMFQPVEAMFALARQLSDSYRVYLLSNVGELHWAHLNANYDLRRLGHGALPSFEAGVMKPHERIYRMAEARFELDPACTVFIDDLEPNAQAARQCGWHAIQHADHPTTRNELRALGVSC